MATSTSPEDQLERLKQLLGLYQLARGDPGWTQGSMPQDPNHTATKSNTALVVVSVLSLSLALMVVTTRFMVRFRGGRELSAVKLDDILVAIATVIAIGFASIQIAVYFVAGGGKHAYDSTFNELSNALHFAYAHLCLYILLAWLIRISVVMMYMRQVSKKSNYMPWVLRFLIGWFTAIFIANLGATLFSCKPIPAAWSLSLRLNGFKCSNVSLEVLVFGIFGTLNNAILVILPLILFWNMDMSRRSRVAYCSVLSLGIFVTVCASVRTFYAYRTYRSYDVTWNSIPLLLWGQLEITFGIIAASLPTMNGIFLRMHKQQSPYKKSMRELDRHSSSTKNSESALNEHWFGKSGDAENFTEKHPGTQVRFLSAPAEYNITDDGYHEDSQAWLMTGKNKAVNHLSTPSISSSVGAGGYQAFPPRPPPPLNSSLPPIPFLPEPAVLQGAAPFITSNWVTRNPTTTTIVALNQLGSDEMPYAESIISSMRSARRSDRRRGSGLTRNHSTTSFTTPSVKEERSREDGEDALHAQRSQSSQSNRLHSMKRAKNTSSVSNSPHVISRFSFAQNEHVMPSPITEKSSSRAQSSFVGKEQRGSIAPSSRYSQNKDDKPKALIEIAEALRHLRDSQDSVESGRVSMDRESLDLPIQIPGNPFVGNSSNGWKSSNI